MSETNGTTRKKSRRLANETFFALCEALRDHREILLNCKTYVEATRVIIDKTGIDCVTSSVMAAMRAVGLVLKVPAARKSPPAVSRILGRALIELYYMLGEMPPDDLVEMMATMDGKKTPAVDAGQAAAGQAVAVASIADPAAIRVVPTTPTKGPK